MNNIVKRSDVVAFYGVPGESGVTYHRMRGFTEFSLSKNPKEYSRQYVDEAFERSDVVGYSPSISYGFDYMRNNAVHQDIVEITDQEKTGSDTAREIVIVDLSTKEAKKRSFTIIPDSEGGSLDAYTYSGSLKASGTVVFGTANYDEETETITFTEGNS